MTLCCVFVLDTKMLSCISGSFSPLHASYELAPYFRCQQLLLRRESRLQCAAWCQRMDACVGVSFSNGRCVVCDYAVYMSEVYDASTNNVVSDFHLALPAIQRCSVGKIAFRQLSVYHKLYMYDVLIVFCYIRMRVDVIHEHILLLTRKTKLLACCGGPCHGPRVVV